MTKKKKIDKLPKPKTDNQKLYINSIKTKPMVISLGPAGTGKTYLASSYAAHYLKEGFVDKVIVTRPNIPTGRSLGFFPGSLHEKMEPWCKPIMTTMEEYLGKGEFEYDLKNGKIEIVPFETIRGRSFDSSFVILDEAQNTTVEEMKAFVTRIGENATVVVNGDVTQSDVSSHVNGLSKILELREYSEGLTKFVDVIKFTRDDIVRSGLCQLWVDEFSRNHETENREALDWLLNL